MSTRQGPPKHQNRYAWKPNAGRKINEKEVGGKLRPFSEIMGVCPRCKEQIDWKRRYGKYKPLTEPSKWMCQRERVFAKCRYRVDQIVGSDAAEVEEEQKMLEEVGLK